MEKAMIDRVSRRSLLKAAGSLGAMAGWPEAAMAFQTSSPIAHEVAVSANQDAAPKYSIRFAVIGIDHNHINGITDAVRRGGGELVSVHSTNIEALADFQKR
jgi:hypothetical protein